MERWGDGTLLRYLPSKFSVVQTCNPFCDQRWDLWAELLAKHCFRVHIILCLSIDFKSKALNESYDCYVLWYSYNMDFAFRDSFGLAKLELSARAATIVVCNTQFQCIGESFSSPSLYIVRALAIIGRGWNCLFVDGPVHRLNRQDSYDTFQ